MHLPCCCRWQNSRTSRGQGQPRKELTILDLWNLEAAADGEKLKIPRGLHARRDVFTAALESGGGIEELRQKYPNSSKGGKARKAYEDSYVPGDAAMAMDSDGEMEISFKNPRKRRVTAVKKPKTRMELMMMQDSDEYDSEMEQPVKKRKKRKATKSRPQRAMEELGMFIQPAAKKATGKQSKTAPTATKREQQQEAHAKAVMAKQSEPEL